MYERFVHRREVHQDVIRSFHGDGEREVMSYVPPWCWHEINPVFYWLWCSMKHIESMWAEVRSKRGDCD